MKPDYTLEETKDMVQKFLDIQEALAPITKLRHEAQLAESYRQQLEIAQAQLRNKNEQLGWAFARIKELEDILKVKQ